MNDKVVIAFLIVGIVGVSIAIAESINYAKIKIQKSDIAEKYSHLEKNYESLNESFNEIQSGYNSLQQEHSVLQNQHNNLQSKYDSFNISYNSILILYSELQSSHNSLQQNYNKLMNDYNSIVSQWNDLVGDWNAVIVFLDDRYGNDTTKFITPNDPDVISVKNSIISSDGDINFEDMKTINNWVNNNTAYNNDTFFDYKNGQFFESFWMFPNETLRYTFGDCEEYATLMVSLCKAEENVDWLWCALTNVTDESGIAGHAMVFVNVGDDKLYIFDTTSGWHSPSAMPENEALNDYCSSFGYDRIDVTAVFDENSYYAFNSNQDFFNWL